MEPSGNSGGTVSDRCCGGGGRHEEQHAAQAPLEACVPVGQRSSIAAGGVDVVTAKLDSFGVDHDV